MNGQTAQKLVPIWETIKPAIDPAKVLNELDQAKKEGRNKFFRVFNTRSNKTVFSLNNGTSNYLFRDPNYIELLKRKEATKILFRLNEKIRTSNYLSFELKRER